MDPMYSYDMSASNEGTKKNNRDFQNINRSNIANTVGADMRIPVFDDTQLSNQDRQLNNQDRQSHKIKQEKSLELQKGGELPKRGTFDPPTFQELVTKSNELFENRHHILSKLSSNGIYDEIDEKDEDLIELMKDTLNQPDMIYKETAKSVVQSCKDSYRIQNLIKEKIFETSQYSSLKNKVDDFYKRSEVFMHAVSSDDEAPSNLDPAVRFDPKEIRKRIKNLPNRNSQAKSRKEIKKRAKKIIKKLKTEAFDCEDYNRSSKNLVELQRLVLRNKIKRAAPAKRRTNIEFNQKTILELKKELENLTTSSKDMKSLQYYEDQISFYRLEKRFKAREKEPDQNEPSILNSNYKLVKKNAARIQNIIMDS